MTKEMQEAITLLEKASRAKPEDMTIRQRLTGALAKAGRFGEAVMSILRAVSVHPEWTQFHYEMIETLTNEGFGSQLRDAAKKLALQEPNNASVWYVLGMMCQTLSDQRGAIASYRKGLEKDPTSAVVYTNLGNALKVVGDEAACIESQQRAIAHSSTIAEPHYTLGVLYMKDGKWDEAKRHFEAFLRLGQPYLQDYFQQAQFSLHILSGGLQENAERPVESSPYWECPKCGTVLKKSKLGRMAKVVTGIATCGNCHAKYSQTDVYGGKYDVEITDETSRTVRKTGKGFDKAKRKWWQGEE